MKDFGFSSRCLHSDRLNRTKRLSAPEHGALHKPIHNNIAFGYDSSRELAEVFQGVKGGFAYGRQANPTVEALENKLNWMENGIATIAFSSGMAAIGATLAALLKEGDHMVSSLFLFGNTNSQLETARRHGVDVEMVDATDVKNVEAALRPDTKLVFVESVANPMTQVADLIKIGDLCEARGILFVVDLTMTSPVSFIGKDCKAGLVIHSLSKYIGGHGNALGGSVTDTGLFDWKQYQNILDLYKKVDEKLWGITQIKKKGLRDFGGSLAPELAHLISVGSDTLTLRYAKASENALALAKMLDQHPMVKKVYYPGLESHPEYNLVAENFKFSGALFSFVLKEELNCFDFLDAMTLVVSSSNLGDNRTLAIPVAHTIFFEMGPEKRKERGIDDNTIRVSVGIEDTEDLLREFSLAFEKK